MTLSTDKITDIFYLIDEFCHHFDQSIKGYVLGNEPKRKPKMSTSEVITLMVLFHPALRHVSAMPQLSDMFLQGLSVGAMSVSR